MGLAKIWKSIRRSLGLLSEQEKREESTDFVRQSLNTHLGFDLAQDMKNNPLKYGVPINLAVQPITTEDIPGPVQPKKPEKKQHRSILDDWEVTQDT